MAEKATKLAFEKHYDDTGEVKAAVRYDSTNEAAIEIMSVSENWTAHFPVSDLDWLIGCLHRVKAEIESA